MLFRCEHNLLRIMLDRVGKIHASFLDWSSHGAVDSGSGKQPFGRAD